LNPQSGFLFNTNHSPFLATDDKKFNLDGKNFDPKDGFETFNNNRSIRVGELMTGVGKVDYETLKRIKYDQQLPAKLEFPYGLNELMNLKATDYPKLSSVITNLQQWDRKAVTDSKGAAVFLLVYDFLSKKLLGADSRDVTRQEAVETYEYVYNYMMKHFKKTDLTLGELQKLVRGDDARPAWGLPDVLTAEYSAPYRNGLRRVTSGDAYICFVRYPKDGLPIIESVNTFGASSNPSSPHYKDQMEMFQKQQLKPMTLDKAIVLKNAKSIYHPTKK
ncbi:MAG: acylase, partial [Chitinophagaceae bacterium]